MAESQAETPRKEPFNIKRYKVNQRLIESFSQDPDQNPFLKALESLPNKYTNQSQIESILGRNFSLITEETKAILQFALLLIKDDMRLYQDTFPFGNPALMRIFKDYYDLMDLKVNPDTIFLNKDSYVFFWEIPESQFVSVYTMLAEKYEEYIPLEKHIEASERSFLRVVHQIVLMKCPDYQHREPEKFSLGKKVESDEPIVEAPFEDKPVEFDQKRIKNIFEVLHTPADPNYVYHNGVAGIWCGLIICASLLLMA